MTAVWTPGVGLEIVTDRFVLRSLVANESLKTQLSWLSDPAVTRFMRPNSSGPDLRSVARYVEHHDNRTSFLLGIFDRDNGIHVGNHRILVDSCIAWLGILIGDRNYWSRGVLSEVRRHVIGFAFDHLDVASVGGRVHSRNHAVIASYQSLGFEFVRFFEDVEVGGDQVWLEFRLHPGSPIGSQADSLSEPPPVAAMAFLSEVLMVPIDEIDAGSRIGTVRKWDSLGHAEIVVALEGVLGRRLTPDEIVGTTTLSAINRLLLLGNLRS